MRMYFECVETFALAEVKKEKRVVEVDLQSQAFLWAELSEEWELHRLLGVQR